VIIETEEAPALESLPAFPLPTAVLFPGIVIPLHIDEPPDCALLADALSGNRLLIVAMMQPGTETDTLPPLCTIAGAGQIIHAEKLEAGDYNVLIQGLDRVRLLEELPQDLPYRRFKIEVIPRPDAEATEAARDEIVLFESTVMRLAGLVAQTDAQLAEVMRSTADPIQLTDFLCATLVSDLTIQQELLATVAFKERLQKLNELLADMLGRTGPADHSVLN